MSQALLSLLACRQGAWTQAAEHARAAQALLADTDFGDDSESAIVHVATARVALHEARPNDARAALARAHLPPPLLNHSFPWLTVQVGLELTRAHLALADAAAARTVLAETECMLKPSPEMSLLVQDARELRKRVAAASTPAGSWAMSLSGAELRLLPYLATHFRFSEIASRLFISRNTVKTQAVSIYRKLGASSRSEAIERAIEVGLIDRSIYPPRQDFTQHGVKRDQADSDQIGTATMGDYKDHLRRLAIHDDALISELLGENNASTRRLALDPRTEALLRFAATVAVDGALAILPVRRRPRIGRWRHQGRARGHPRSPHEGVGIATSRAVRAQAFTRPRLRRRRGARATRRW